MQIDGNSILTGYKPGDNSDTGVLEGVGLWPEDSETKKQQQKSKVD